MSIVLNNFLVHGECSLSTACQAPHTSAAAPTSRISASRFAISTATMAASAPLFPALPPARSMACIHAEQDALGDG